MTIITQLRSLREYVSLRPEGSAFLWLQQGTALALFSFCVLVSSFQYFGEPIQCVQDRKDDDAAINERVMNSFCFISSTYTVLKDRLGHECDAVGKYYPFPGVGPNPADGKDIRKHSYYVWIPFLLFFQGLTFLVPRSYWNHCEGGLVERLVAGVKGIDFAPSVDQNKKKIREIAFYFQKRLKTWMFFSFSWIFRDFLAFIIVIGNFFLTDSLLGGWWTAFFSFGRGNCWSPLDDAFPKLTKCTFHKFGAGGGLQNFDSICVMALNVVNEKVYVILWFWFLLLTPLSLLYVLLKIGTVIALQCLTGKRLKALLQFRWMQLAIGIPSFTSSKGLALFADSFHASDWIFFTQLTSRLNMADQNQFVSVVEELVQIENTTRDDECFI